VVAPGQFTGFTGEPGIVGERKLNRFLQSPEVLHCPADIGDTLSPVNSPDPCFQMYGTSYIVHFHTSNFGLGAVTAPDVPPAPFFERPMKIGNSRFRDLTRKVLAADWNLHPNRLTTFEKTMWHHKAKVGQPRRHNILFGDFHAEDYTFKMEYEENGPNPWLPLNPDRYGVW
jgi:hypothetical protein